MPTRTELAHDERGAIAVFGLFASVFLVGQVYFMVSTAHTVLQREGLQLAADSSVYAASVAEARGMNMIAAMNVLIGALTAVLLPLRAMIPAYAEVATLSNGTDPCSIAVRADAVRASTQLGEISSRAEQRIGALFVVLSDAQGAIARTTPRLAASAASGGARANDGFLDREDAELMGPATSPSGCRLGLPVEEDSFTTACKRGKAYTPALALRLAGETLQTIGACKSGEMALALAVPTFPLADTLYCKEAEERACSARGGQSGGKPHPKKVFAEAKNGSDWMQSWARVRGKPFDDARRGVELGAFGARGSEADRRSNVAFAQSEIYSDCEGAWSTCNKDEHALWDTQWTARMRRIAQPKISWGGDGVVKSELTDPRRWSSERQRLVESRQTPWLDGQATSEAARLLRSSEEGPLQ
jgi:hypothetical protein